MNKKKNNKGFSLIELIIAIAILIILTGLLAPQFMKYIEKSRLAKDMQTLDTVYSAVQGAIADEDAYQDLVGKMSETGSTINSKGGIKLEDLMSKDDDKTFAKELTTLLGKSAADIDSSFQSRLAASKKGNVYVAIDDQMQVVVSYGTGADAPAEDGGNVLTVGKAAFEKSSSEPSS